MVRLGNLIIYQQIHLSFAIFYNHILHRHSKYCKASYKCQQEDNQDLNISQYHVLLECMEVGDGVSLFP